ncbi:MAG TPA: DUF4129 domain-containing protein [Kofleriaceae bacterium]|nr:DUF4129 domain-containing protein [Kofleriaceae bacterium]
MARILSLIVSGALAAGPMAVLAGATARSVAAAPAPGTPPAEAPGSGSVGRELEHALGDSHQRDLPGVDPQAPEARDDLEHDADLDRLHGRRDDPADRAPEADGGAPVGPLSSVASMLLWGLVIAASLVMAMAIYRQVSDYTSDEPLPDTPRTATDAQLAAVVERPRDDADELAAEGRFADAIHTLLLRTLHELASQNLVRVTRAMTSREILARVSLLGEAREALAGLIVAVEQTWFGDDVPQLADYQRCRAQFDLFAAAYRRGAGARA